MMKHKQIFSVVSRWIRPLLLVTASVLVVSACKSEMSGPSGGGMPSPPSGGMPPPGGGMPAPPSPPGGQSGGQSGGESGESSGESSGDSGAGMPGGGMPGGQDGPSGSSGGADGAGEVGSFPGGEAEGLPPPPSERGGSGAGGPEAGGVQGDGDSDSDSDSDSEGESDSECGDTGALPGGVGGMGEAGECLGGGAAAAEAEESSEASGGGGSGAAAGGEEAVAGTGGAGSVGEFPEESAEARAERLGKELDESIGGFDEVLMEEQREISSVGRNTEGFGEGAGGSGGSGGISLGEQSAGSGNVTIANTGMARTSPTDGMTQEEIRERTPDDVAVMVDDDIIARQLREAALTEKDPALRERLWEEYRKYKDL